ncbi:MAG: hypothetical protein KBS91_01085, partial [Firmicutes bacterium]|nr:hypothetical protein [Candidatus Caballimonas caccae]
MKKKISFLLLFVFLLSAFSFVGAFGCKDSAKINWDNLHIKNFENYSALGAANIKEEQTKSASSHIVYADTAEQKKAKDVKLVGITGTGECEEITFVNDKGKISKQSAHLIGLKAYTRYSLACFATWNELYFEEGLFDEDSFYGWCPSYSYYNRFPFIIDNLTGKIYDATMIIVALSKNESSKIERGENNYIR